MKRMLLGDDEIEDVPVQTPKELEEDRLKREMAYQQNIYNKKIRLINEGETLATMHPHPRDDRIVFNEAAHTYHVDGKKVPESVSGWIERFLPPFDTEAVMKQIFNEKATIKVGEKYIIRPDHKTSKYKGMTREEALQKFADAPADGTYTHAIIEKYCDLTGTSNPLWFTDDERKAKMLSIRIDGKEIPEKYHNCLFQMLQFETSISKDGWRLYRVEWSIFSEKYDIAGQIDALYYKTNPDTGLTEYALVDWKRMEANLKKNNGRGDVTNFAYYPIAHLPNTKGTRYALQLNRYREILVEMGLNVVMMMLVILDPNKTTFTLEKIPIMKKEIDAMCEASENVKRFREHILKWEQSGGMAATSIHPRYPLPPFYEKQSEYIHKEPEEEPKIEDGRSTSSTNNGSDIE